jgi:hypothetical protein
MKSLKTALCAGAFAAALGCAAALVPVQAAAPASSAIPNFMSTTAGWLLSSGTNFLPVPGQTAPVSWDPKHPYVGNNQGQQSTERVADIANPNLKPWAVAEMKKHNDAVLGGKRSFVAQARCWPGNTPSQLLFPAEPVFFIQTPKEVWIIWQRDHHVRRVMLDRPHTANPKPSWFGESVGHYENGNTLVIDTIGIQEHAYNFVDNFRTPHTKALHVVERWTIMPDGKAIEATVTVDDPGTFNRPWSGKARWNRVERGPMIESVCAENNVNFFNLDEYEMPEAKTPDF